MEMDKEKGIQMDNGHGMEYIWEKGMSWLNGVRFTFQAHFSGSHFSGPSSHHLAQPDLGSLVVCLDPTIRSKLPLWRAVMRHCL